jgi:NAD(P)H-binding
MRVDKTSHDFTLVFIRVEKRESESEGEMTYLITGATGDVGSRVVAHLLKRNLRPRVLARNDAKARLLFGPRVDVFVGDLAEPASFREALEGIDALFLVNVGPEIPQRDEAAAMLAKEMGVKKIVKLSSLDVEHGLAIGAWHEKGEGRDPGGGCALHLCASYRLHVKPAGVGAQHQDGTNRQIIGWGWAQTVYSLRGYRCGIGGGIGHRRVLSSGDPDYGARLTHLRGGYRDHC